MLSVFSCMKKDSKNLQKQDMKNETVTLNEEKIETPPKEKKETEMEKYIIKQYKETQQRGEKVRWEWTIDPEEGKKDIRYSARLADKYRKQEKYEKAIEEYKRIVKTWGDIKEGWDWEIVARAAFFLGEIYYKELDDIEKALFYYKKLQREYTGARIMEDKEIQKAENLAKRRISEINEKQKK